MCFEFLIMGTDLRNTSIVNTSTETYKTSSIIIYSISCVDLSTNVRRKNLISIIIRLSGGFLKSTCPLGKNEHGELYDMVV